MVTFYNDLSDYKGLLCCFLKIVSSLPCFYTESSYPKWFKTIGTKLFNCRLIYKTFAARFRTN